MEGVSALRRGFQVLECFADARRPLGNSEVAQRTGLPPATVSRLVSTLVSLGHLRPSLERERYELAAGVVRLAQAFLGAIDVRRHARPHLVALAEGAGASSFLGIRDGDDMLVIEAARSRSSAVLLSADVGSRMTMWNSALGRAWLAAVDEPVRDAVLDRWRTRPDAPALTDARLAQALEAARTDGFALSVGEWHPTINSLAVPIRTANGDVICINCGGPAYNLPEQRLRTVVGPRVRQAARLLAEEIGGVSGLDLIGTARSSSWADRTATGARVSWSGTA